jgi:hypothetical protein
LKNYCRFGRFFVVLIFQELNLPERDKVTVAYGQ